MSSAADETLRGASKAPIALSSSPYSASRRYLPGGPLLSSGRSGEADRDRDRLVAVLGGRRPIARAVDRRPGFSFGRSRHCAPWRPSGSRRERCLFGTGLAALATAQSLAAFLVAWVLIGLGMGAGLYDPAFATLGRLYGHGGRSAITALTLFGGFASTVCWPLSAFLDAYLGWRGACLVYASFQLAIALPAYLFVLPRKNLDRSSLIQSRRPRRGPALTRRNLPGGGRFSVGRDHHAEFRDLDDAFGFLADGVAS